MHYFLIHAARTDYTGEHGIVAGWGRLGEKRSTAIELMKVSVPMMTMENCRKSGYGATRITDNMVCAGYPEGKKDACQVCNLDKNCISIEAIRHIHY
jgi:Trypsin